MGWPELLPLFTQGGALGVFAFVLYLFYREARRADQRAVAAEKQRADDWKAAWQAEVKRSSERDAQVAHILTAVRDATGSAQGKQAP